MQDNRKTVLLVLVLAAMLFSLFTMFVWGGNSGETSVSARAAVLYEPTSGEFIYEKNMNERLPMASTTKIMTALLAIELCRLDAEVTVPKEAVGIEGSSVYLKEGDLITVTDLIYSVLLQSANDASVALAIHIAGDVYSFSVLMNNRALEMGLFDTNFENPHGLDSENHYTTAHDLAIIASHALDNDIFREIVSTYKYEFTISGSPRIVVNHNKLLKKYDGAIGVKTGYTKKCGRCLVGAAERDGLRLITVTLNAPNDWADHEKLFNLGFKLADIDNKKEA